MTTRQSMFLVLAAALALGWAGSAAAGDLPATGQTTCYDSGGAVIPCTGTGQDGDIQAGKTLSYKDEGDGTIEDKVTDLVWEKKSDDGSIHDKDETYTWDEAFDVHVAELNTPPCFAGTCDWRLPNVKELQSIVNYENVNPSVSSAFNNSCDSGDTVTDGSCTAASPYWSSTTIASRSASAWLVGFFLGNVFFDDKASPRRVRAVRGGL